MLLEGQGHPSEHFDVREWGKRDMAIDFGTLVDSERGLLDPRIYTDRELYDLELTNIFGRAWCFLGHETLVPKTGDFIQTYIGEDPVLMVRQRDGSIKAFLNQCRHRGMRICRADTGNIKAFTCTYHGWTYDISGRLINVPHEEDGYHNELDKDAWGPVQVAQIENYKGLVFATWDPSAPSFREYLGDMAWYLDAHIDRFEGGTEFLPGVHYRWVIDCNWKFAAEQFAGDAYHGMISHGSALQVYTSTQQAGVRGTDQEAEMQRLDQQRRQNMREGKQFSAPQGHGTGGLSLILNPSGQGSLVERWQKEQEASVLERLGEIRLTARGHSNIFPNFSYLANGTMRVWHPRGPNQIEVWAWTMVPKSAPDEVKQAIKLDVLRTFSGSGIFEQDDGENWNEIQKVLKGHVARTNKLNMQMGLGHARIDADGFPGRTLPQSMGEEPARGMYRRWRDMVSGLSWDELSQRDEQWKTERISV
jgi:3-phenylpropionate/trans-cinnamate dioxygenase alpha subunit